MQNNDTVAAKPPAPKAAIPPELLRRANQAAPVRPDEHQSMSQAQQ